MISEALLQKVWFIRYVMPAALGRCATPHTLGALIVHNGGEQDETQESPVPPGIEEVACNEKQEVLGTMTGEPVQHVDDAEEEREDGGVEEHQSAVVVDGEFSTSALILPEGRRHLLIYVMEPKKSGINLAKG